MEDSRLRAEHLQQVTTSTLPQPQPHHRLLYRGSLSLPDSHLLLDGLTFTGQAGKSTSLLENPLALALESMRGRPTLRFLGTMNLSEGWVDYSGGVCLDIHPQATLSRIYFENIFCLSPVSSARGKTDVGVRIALGDNNGPETTEIIIYGQLLPCSSSSPHPTLQLNVARLTPTPPASSPSPSLQNKTLRPPRPDDPTPRRIPVSFALSSTTKSKRSAPSTTPTSSKRRKLDSTTKEKGEIRPGGVGADEDVRLAREVMLYGAAIRSASGPGRDRDLGEDGDGVFKIPVVPVRSKVKLNGNGKGKGRAVADVFGVIDVDGDSSSRSRKGGGKGKGKTKLRFEECDGDFTAEREGDEVGEVEKLNRAKIKKQTVRLISSPPHRLTPPPTRPLIQKTHPEFKDLFGHVYRGVAFALRRTIKTDVLDMSTVTRLVEAHLTLYIPVDDGAAAGGGGDASGVAVADDMNAD